MLTQNIGPRAESIVCCMIIFIQQEIIQAEMYRVLLSLRIWEYLHTLVRNDGKTTVIITTQYIPEATFCDKVHIYIPYCLFL